VTPLLTYQGPWCCEKGQTGNVLVCPDCLNTFESNFMSKEHELKIWPVFYEARLAGDMLFNTRLNDRSFQKGDTLLEREWDPDLGKYTGRTIHSDVSYVLSGWGVQAGHVVMSLRDMVFTPKASKVALGEKS
jgi:hypothetical protein